MTFGERVKTLRQEAGWTQEELGEKIHVSARVIGYYEADDRFPKNQTILLDLAKAFQVSLDYLLDNPVRQEATCPSRFCYVKTINAQPRNQVNDYIRYLRWKQRREREEEELQEHLDPDAEHNGISGIGKQSLEEALKSFQLRSTITGE